MAVEVAISSDAKKVVASGSIIVRLRAPVSFEFTSGDEKLTLTIVLDDLDDRGVMLIDFVPLGETSARAILRVTPDSLVPVIFPVSPMGSLDNRDFSADFAVERYNAAAIMTYAFYLGAQVHG